MPDNLLLYIIPTWATAGRSKPGIYLPPPPPRKCFLGGIHVLSCLLKAMIVEPEVGHCSGTASKHVSKKTNTQTEQQTVGNCFPHDPCTGYIKKVN
jgi:hypothetical protein